MAKIDMTTKNQPAVLEGDDLVAQRALADLQTKTVRCEDCQGLEALCETCGGSGRVPAAVDG